MKIEVATKLRAIWANAVAEAESIIAAELAAAGNGLPVVVDPPEPDVDVTTGYGPHGFTAADDDGFARFKAIDEWLATVPKRFRDKFPTRFCTPELWEMGAFPSAIAREKCYMNLISRMTSPADIPAFFNWDAWTFSVTKLDTAGERDWNVGPLQAAKTYRLDRAELMVGKAWSTNWKPGGEAALLEALKEKLARELEPKDPIDGWQR